MTDGKSLPDYSQWLVEIRGNLRTIDELASRGEFSNAIASLDDLLSMIDECIGAMEREQARRRALEGMRNAR